MGMISRFTFIGIFFAAFFISLALSGHGYAADLSNGEASRTDDPKVGKEIKWHITDPITKWNIYWKEGLHLEGRYERWKFDLGGDVMVDAGDIRADDALQEAFPDLEGGNVLFRKLSVDVKGSFFKAADFKIEMDFANIREINDMWIRFTKLPVLDHIRFGNMKEPVSLEELTSGKNTTFMESALPVQAFAPGRNIGMRYDNGLLEDRMTVSLGGFWATGSLSDVGDAKNQLSESYGFNLTGRLTYLPVYENEGTRILHLGLSLSHQFRDENDENVDFQFRARPESRLTDDRLVDTGTLFSDGGDLIGVELAHVSGPFSLQGELLHVGIDAGENLHFWGYYLYGSYFLTGENRVYNKRQGLFSFVKPRHSFHPLKGEWGAFELGLRYSYVDLNDGPIRGGKERDVTVGLNWYLYPKVRVMLNYIHARVDDRADPTIDDGRANIFQTRLQFSF